LRFGHDQIEGMKCAWDDMEFARHAGTAETLGVVKVLCVEQVERAYTQPRWWQSTQVVAPRWNRRFRVGASQYDSQPNRLLV
jgi:predicted FMN-binding regulatory protein PaiB